MKKKIFFCITILLLLSGCWNYKELNNYCIITGIAIDKTDNNEYEISLLISNASKSESNTNENNSEIVVYSGTGDTIVKALKETGLIVPNELYLGSFSVLILSEDVAKDGINDVVDFFYRYSNARKNFNVVITKDTKAKDVIKIITPLSSFSSQNISDNLNSTSQLQGIVAKTNFNEILATLLRDGSELSINYITIKGDEDKGENKENLESSEPKSYIKLGPLGIFKGDKLIDFATYDESLGINIINDKIDEIYFKINYNDGYVVIDTTDIKTKRLTSVKNNKPIVNLNIKGEGKIIEASGSFDLENPKTIEKIQKQANIQLKKYINKAMNLAIKNKTDIFGFGLSFHQNHNKYFESIKNNWNDNLGNIDLKIDSNLILKGKVSAKNSLEETNDEKDN